MPNKKIREKFHNCSLTNPFIITTKTYCISITKIAKFMI